MQQITITITNPSPAMLDFLRGVHPNAPLQPAITVDPLAVVDETVSAHEMPILDGLVRTPDDLRELFDGKAVHWHGAKFQFDGTVEEVFENACADDIAVRVRRDDTDKVVRLTYNDLQTGMLVKK